MPILKNKRVVIPLAVVAVIIIFAVVFIIVKNNAYEFYKAGINSYENQEAKMSLVYFKQVTKYPKMFMIFQYIAVKLKNFFADIHQLQR